MRLGPSSRRNAHSILAPMLTLSRIFRVGGHTALFLGVLCALLNPSPALAQGVTTAAIQGVVVDSDDNPVAGADLTLEHLPTGTTASMSTGPDGRYYLPNLRPGGPFRLTVRRLGFADQLREEIRLQLGQITRIDITLREEAVPLPEIDVRVETDPEFNPSRMGVSTLIDEQTVQRLPTLSRDFVDFSTLSPLVKISEEGVSIAGSNLRFNNIQVDGALNQDVFGLSPNGISGGRANARIIPLEAIEQFEVLVAPYDVRQSGFTGGVLNAVTRSGTNDWTGSAYGYWRDEILVGDLIVDDVSRKPDELDNVYLGLTLGGPIVRDRAHFFVAAELEQRKRPPAGFHVGESDPLRTRIAPDSAQRLVQILNGFGADPGTVSSFPLENGLANAFARFDVQISQSHQALLRYNYAGAVDDLSPNRLPGDAYELSSAGTEIESDNHSVVFQLLSTLSDVVSNEFLTNVQFIRESERALANYPRVEVDISSDVGEETVTQRVRAGANLFAHANELEQTLVQVTDNVTFALGRHRLLGGGSLKRFGIRRLYVPGSLGSYRFASLADLEANQPQRYDITLPLTEGDAAANFSVLEWAAYLQDEWTVSDALNVRIGLRVDIPMIRSEPTFNPAVQEDFSRTTSELPSGKALFSPRVGFNLRLGDEGSTQIRGGAGLFTGRPPFAWLANAFQETGLETASLGCEGTNAPAFAPMGPAPVTCADGSGATEGLSTINMFDPDFKFPQNYRASLAIDQRLPGGVIASLGAIYTKAVHQIFLEDLNVSGFVDPRLHEEGFSDGFGYHTRAAFGEPTIAAFEPFRQSDRFAQVINITNRSDDFAYALTAELKRYFADHFAFQAGYSYSRSADTQSLISLDATSNFGLNPIEGLPNQPKRQASLFDRPHKVVLTATARFLERLGGTEVTLLYVGQSGAPYSYVYVGDVNADGYPGAGRALDLTNDLIYVGANALDFPGKGFVSAILFERLVGRESCLEENRTKVLFRNACRAPWANQLDLRVAQHLRLGGARVQVVLDMFNVLNFLSDDWGHVLTVNPVVQVLQVAGRERGADLPPGVPTRPTDPLTVRYVGLLERTEDGARAGLPHTFQIPNSQWQAQLGLRVSF